MRMPLSIPMLMVFFCLSLTACTGANPTVSPTFTFPPDVTQITTPTWTPTPLSTPIWGFYDLLNRAAIQAPFTLLVPDEAKLPFAIEHIGLDFIPGVKTQPFVVTQSYRVRGSLVRITQTSQPGQIPAKAVGQTTVRGVVGYWVVLNIGERLLYWEENNSSLTISGDLADADILILAGSLAPREADTQLIQDNRCGAPFAPVEQLALPPVAPTPPARLTGATATYTDRLLGYAIDYPEDWYLKGEPGETAILTSFPWENPGRGGLGAGQAKIDLLPAKPNECTSLQDLVEEVRNGEGKILWEQQWMLAEGIPAVRMQVDSDVFGESAVLLTVIHGHCLRLAGMGDTSLFNAVATSLRPSP
jgi:hypothetical protein